MKQRILVIDDEPDVVDLIAFNLRGAGFDVVTAADGVTGLKRARAPGVDLVILDLMLPGIDGIEVCKTLRRDPVTGHLPIIMVTARTGEIDRVLGLELGADDYVTKPFSVRELVLRVRALLRRRAPASTEVERITCGELHLDLACHEVKIAGAPVELTTTEFKLLALLAGRRGRVQSRETLLREVWDYEPGVDSRTVDTHMRRLREKLGHIAEHLETVRGVGYRLRVPEE
jgi:two-component system phosphate regulon response regulator PhoB